MTATRPATRYLQHLPASQIRSPRPVAARPSRARLGHLLGLLTLLAAASLAAAAAGRLAGVMAAAGPATPWPERGCLDASVDRLGQAGITGRARLCVSETGAAALLDLEHLEPLARYEAWAATFEQPGRCRFAALQLQVPMVHQPCILADLEGPDPAGSLEHLGGTLADARGASRLDHLLPRVVGQPHTLLWLVVGRPPAPASAFQPTPAPWRPAQVDLRLFEARAIFELP